MPIYKYDKINDVQGDVYPLSAHLVFEVSANKIYFVQHGSPKVLKKTTDGGATVSTVETRTNKDIARAWHDRDNNKIYFVDCDYDDSTSYIWSINTSTDAVTEITNLSGDVFDIWIYNNHLYYYYFASDYATESGFLDPNGDGSPLDWSSSGGNHYTEIDEGGTPSTSDYVYSDTENDEDEYTFPNGLDLSSYDYHSVDPTTQIYELVVWVYAKYGQINVNGNLTGMTEQTLLWNSATYEWKYAVFTGLALEDSDLDALEITVENVSEAGYLGDVTTLHSNWYHQGICEDSSGNYYVVSAESPDWRVFVNKYNSSWVYQAQYDIEDDLTSWGVSDICWDGTYFYSIARDGKVRKWSSSWVYQTEYDISGQITWAFGITWDGSYFWISDRYTSAQRIYKYDSSFTYQSYYVDITPYMAGSLSWDGTYYYNLYGGRIRIYDSSWVFQDEIWMQQCWDYNTGGDVGWFDGTYFYMVYTDGYHTGQFLLRNSRIDTLRVEYKFYDDLETRIFMRNHTLSTSQSYDMGSPVARSWESSQIVLEGVNLWFLWKWSDENVELWKHVIGTSTFTEMEDCGSGTDFPDSESQWGISYDDIDTLYFVLQDTGDSKNYLHTYEITDDNLTKGGEYNIALMLNRNTDQNNDQPFNLEKGFHLTDRKIYQIASSKGRLFKIADLTTELADGTIVGITDSYMFVLRSSTDVELWEFVDFEDDVLACTIRRSYGTVSMATIQTAELLGNGVFVQLYKGTETEPSFKGYIKKKEYDGFIRTYECIGQEKELYKDRFTDDLSSVTIKNAKNIMEYLIDTYANFCDYILSPDSIDPDSDFITTYDNLVFNNKTLHEAFSVLMDYEDGIYSVDADGIIYAWAIASIPSEENDAVDWVVTQATGEILNDPRVVEIQEPLNKIILYGAVSAGARLKSIANDLSSQTENGINDYVDHFPHVNNQTDLDSLSEAILNKTGLINPMYVHLMLKDDEKRLIGWYINLQFVPYTELASADDYFILEMTENLKQLHTDFVVSSGLVQTNREEEVDMGKTSNADEEQIDILAETKAEVIAEWYYVSTTAELEAAITDIESNNYNGRILVTADLTDVQITFNDASCSYMIEGITPNVTLDANGDNTIITISAAASVVIRDLTFDSTDITTSTKPIIYCGESSDNKVLIENCTFVGDATLGIPVSLGQDNVTFTKCYITHAYYVVWDNVGCNNIRITENHWTGANVYFGVYKQSSTVGHGWVIGFNICAKTTTGSNISLKYLHRSTVVGNVMMDIKVNDSFFISCDYVQLTSIIGNSGYYMNVGVYFGNNCHYNAIVGNTFYGQDENSIYWGAGICIGKYWSASDSDNNLITGNQCYGFTNSGSGYGWGISIARSDCDENTVVGNHCRGNKVNYNDSGTNTYAASNNTA